MAAFIVTAFCPGALAGKQPSSERRRQIESLLSKWKDVKLSAGSMRKHFLSQQDGGALQRHVEEAWSMCEERERGEDNRLKHLLSLLDEELLKRKISRAERNRRADAALKIFQVRMLFVYGNLMPRILDESIVNEGRQVGRRYAGSEWKVSIREDEVKSLQEKYKALSGFPHKLLNENSPFTAVKP